MNNENWVAWAMQTSRTWSDIKDVVEHTNIDFIDNDHRILVEYALDLNRVIEKSQKNFTMELINETKDVLDRFYEYAEEHFRREEIFMDMYELPNINQHKHEHNRILSILRKALDDFESGKVKVSVKLKMQVMDWLIKHVNIVDVNYFDIKNWNDNLLNASNWDEIKPIIHLTGISDIDEQHMVLTNKTIVMIDELINGLTDKDIIESTYDDVIEYAEYHFEYEHQFMIKYNIGLLDEHLEKHDYFISEMKRFKGLTLDETADYSEIKSWILTWWIDHINNTDRNYFAYENWAYDLIANAVTMDEVEIVLRRTGIEEVDEDHLALMEIMLSLNNEINRVELINGQKKSEKTGANKISNLKSFIDGKKASPDAHRKVVLDYLDQAYHLAVEHFSREEKIMEEMGSHDLVSHRKSHQEVLIKLIDVRRNYEEGLLDASSNIKTMILDWWIDHTNTTDFRTFVLRNEDIFDERR